MVAPGRAPLNRLASYDSTDCDAEVDIEAATGNLFSRYFNLTSFKIRD